MPKFHQTVSALVFTVVSLQATQLFFLNDQNYVWKYPTNDGSNRIEERPPGDNFVSPDNYTVGNVYVRFEVLDKPSSKELGVQLCFWKPGWSPETCSDQGKIVDEGVYYWKWSPPVDWWRHGNYDWSTTWYKARVFLKDGNNASILMANKSCGSYCYTGTLSDHVPVSYSIELFFTTANHQLIPPNGWVCPSEWGCGNDGSYTEAPVFSPAAGVIREPVTVTMTSATSGATVYYTIDGSTPTTSSRQYSSAVEVSQTTTLKAFAVSAGLKDSRIVEATYTLKQLSEGILPVQAVSASKHDGNVPENTIDDDLNTRWSADGTDEWIMFDLGSEKTVGSVWIAWYQGASRISDFGISISTDGSSWTSVYDGRSSGTTTELEQHSFSPVTARYVRIDCHGNSVNNWNSITEVQISEKSGTVVSYNQRRIHRTPDLNRPTHAVSYTLLGKRLTAGKVRGMHGVIVQSSGGVTRKVLRQRESVR